MTTPAPDDNESCELEQWFTAGRVGLLLAALMAAVFPGILIGTETFFRSDYAVIGYPALDFLRDAFRSAKLPLWNPYSNCGAPFLAQWGTMCLYPGNLFFLFLPFTWALGVFCVGHLWLGGMGMYCLAREWTGNRIGAAFAAMIFAFNGVAFSCLIWPNYCVALGWMPWLALASRRAWLEGGRWIPIASLAGATQMIVGVPELVLMTWALLSALWWMDRPEPGRLRLRWGLAFPGMVLLVSALSAAQLMPFFDLLDQSQRDASFRDMRWPMPIWGWANFFVPLFHYGRTDQGLYMQQGQFFLASYYLGLGSLAFAFLGVWRGRDRLTRVLTVATALALVLALGHKGGLYSLLAHGIPSGGIARYPIKFVLLTAFTVPLLAAIGVGQFLRELAARDEQRFRRVTAVIVAVIVEVLILVVLAHVLANRFDRLADLRLNTAGRLILFGLFALAFLKGTNPEIALRLRKIYLTLALLFLGADLATHLPNHCPRIPAAVLSADLREAAPDRETRPRFNGEMARAMILPAAEKALLNSAVMPWEADITGKRLALWSNLNLLEDVPKVNGSMTLRQGFEDQIQSALYPAEGEAPAAEGLKDFLCVRWVTHPTEVVKWTNRPSARPFATAGVRVKFSDDPKAAIAHLISDRFDPRKEVLLASEAGLTNGVAYATNTVASVTNLIFGLNRVQFEVEAAEPTVAVVAQSFNRNWMAWVNDQRRPLLRANHAFQAVPVPAGRSVVRLEYVDRPFWTGLGISLLGLLVCGVWIAMDWRREGNEVGGKGID